MLLSENKVGDVETHISYTSKSEDFFFFFVFLSIFHIARFHSSLLEAEHQTVPFLAHAPVRILCLTSLLVMHRPQENLWFMNLSVDSCTDSISQCML